MRKEKSIYRPKNKGEINGGNTPAQNSLCQSCSKFEKVPRTANHRFPLSSIDACQPSHPRQSRIKCARQLRLHPAEYATSHPTKNRFASRNQDTLQQMPRNILLQTALFLEIMLLYIKHIKPRHTTMSIQYEEASRDN